MCGLQKKIQSKKPKKKTVTIIPREEWGAKPIHGHVTHLKHPVQYIRYGYTGTGVCKTQYKCVPILQEYQQKFLDNDFADQPFNFLVGGDGLVYEGRGWQLDADRPEKINKKIRGKAIDIGYIGDFSDQEPTDKMTEAVKLLLDLASEEKYLQDCSKTLNLNDYQPVLEDD